MAKRGKGTEAQREGKKAGKRWHYDIEQIVLILLSARLPSVPPFLS